MADYVDIDIVHEYGGFTDPTEITDTLLEELLSAAKDSIDGYCDRTFISEETAVISFTRDNGLLPISGERDLWLPFDLCSQPVLVPVLGVTLIPTYAPWYMLVLDADEGFWPDPTTIEGHWAYSRTPPAKIVEVCLKLTMWSYRNREGADAKQRDELAAIYESLVPFVRRILP